MLPSGAQPLLQLAAERRLQNGDNFILSSTASDRISFRFEAVPMLRSKENHHESHARYLPTPSRDAGCVFRSRANPKTRTRENLA